MGPAGKTLSVKVSIFMGIGINQAGDRAMLCRNFRLDAAPGMMILAITIAPFTEMPIRSSFS